jgi:hypothetical protein
MQLAMTAYGEMHALKCLGQANKLWWSLRYSSENSFTGATCTGKAHERMVKNDNSEFNINADDQTDGLQVG